MHISSLSLENISLRGNIVSHIYLLSTTLLRADPAGISISLGILIGLLASFVQSLGLAIQRRSHVLNAQLPVQDHRVEHRRPLWLLGFAIFLTSNLFGSLVQIASLPVVILAPLGAVSLLWNALFAGLLFRPPLLLGTFLIAGGASLIAVYGVVPETTRSLAELIALFRRPAFLGWFSVEATLLAVSLAFTHVIEYSYSRRVSSASFTLHTTVSPTQSPALRSIALPSTIHQQPSTSTTSLTEELTTAGLSERTPLLDRKQSIFVLQKTCSLPSPTSSLSPTSYGLDTQGQSSALTPSSRTPLLLALAYAAASGTLSGLCLVFAKSGVELLLLTFNGSNQFHRWEAWILVGGLIIFALGQLWYMNRALRLASPAVVCPSAFCFYNCFSILNGLVYFDQLRFLSARSFGLVVLGMVILLAGVWAVSISEGEGGINVDIGTWQEGNAGADADAEVDVGGQADSVVRGRTGLRDEVLDTRREDVEQTLAPREPAPDGTVDEESKLPVKSTREPTSRSRIRPRPHAIPMDRQTVSEGVLRIDGRDEESSDRLWRSHIEEPTIARGTLSPEGAASSAKQHQRYSILAGRDVSTSTHSFAGSSMGGPLSPALGGGFAIGLSPASPGFSLVPWERRRTSGLGLLDVVEHTSRSRRRSGKERGREEETRGEVEDGVGAWQESSLQPCDLETNCGDDQDAQKDAESRWTWLKKMFLPSAR